MGPTDHYSFWHEPLVEPWVAFMSYTWNIFTSREEDVRLDRITYGLEHYEGEVVYVNFRKRKVMNRHSNHLPCLYSEPTLQRLCA